MDPVDELLAAWQVELPGVLRTESELVKRVMLLAGALTEVTAPVLAEHGLTPAEHDVLAALRRTGPTYACTPTQLARATLMSSGGTSNVVNRLVRRGLVERRADQDDRRSSKGALTPAGLALAETAVAATTDAHAAVLAGVSPEALDAAADALRTVFAGAVGVRRPASGTRGRHTPRVPS